jgi:hypothetical protein
LGFGVAVAVLALSVAYARGQAAEKRKVLLTLVEKRRDMSEEEIGELVDSVHMALPLGVVLNPEDE